MFTNLDIYALSLWKRTATKTVIPSARNKLNLPSLVLLSGTTSRHEKAAGKVLPSLTEVILDWIRHVRKAQILQECRSPKKLIKKIKYKVLSA